VDLLCCLLFADTCIAGRNPGWDEHQARRVRYLLVACFIASNNPADSDLMKLTEAQSGRRKRQRAGVDDVSSDHPSSAAATGKGSLSGRCFSQERLHGIFCLMVTAGQGLRSTDSMFGDSGLNSTVSALSSIRLSSNSLVCRSATSWSSACSTLPRTGRPLHHSTRRV
jgi:hypothetical protein